MPGSSNSSVEWRGIMLSGGQKQRVAAAEQLRSFRFEVELVTEPEVGHTVSISGAARALQFLQRQFDY